MWLSLMPSSFSTPEDKSTPNGLISLRISWIFFILIPPDKHHGLSVCRFFNIYGPFQRNEFVIPKFINKVKKNQPIEIYGNGKQIRSFCYVDDAVEALIKIIFKKSKDKIYNIGNNKEPISINNLAKLIINLANKKITIKKINFLNESIN